MDDAPQLKHKYGRIDKDYAMALATRAPEDDGPIYMVNLMKYHEVAQYDGADTEAAVAKYVASLPDFVPEEKGLVVAGPLRPGAIRNRGGGETCRPFPLHQPRRIR